MKNKAEEFWKGVYRVGTAPMCTVETEWDVSAKITREELKLIGETGSNKSPGIDGVPNSALKAVIRGDGENFLTMLNNTIESGSSGKLSSGAIILIQKVSQPTSPADYRPIALLNT